MLTVLGGLAEFERELIRARTGEGRERAKDRGVRFGRPRKLTAHQRREALARLAAGETQADVGRSYNVDATTIARHPGDVHRRQFRMYAVGRIHSRVNGFVLPPSVSFGRRLYRPLSDHFFLREPVGIAM
jgi:DNA invertase Pin-like site-specific DNA recombinase